MTATFEGNLKALEKCRPKLHRQICDWIRTNPSWRSQDSKSQRSLHRSIEGLREKAMVIVLGMPTAEGLKRLLAEKTDYQKIFLIIERDIGELVRFSLDFDLSEFVKNPEFQIYIPGHLGEMRTFIRDFMVDYNAVSSNLGIVMNSSSEDDRAFFQKTIEQIHAGRELANIWMGNSIDDSLFGLKNTVENMEVCVSNFGFEALRDRFRGLTAVSVASGPALNEALPFLKSHRDEFAIIACDSSLKPLLDAGIMPHFVTAIEREEIVTTYFRGVSLDPSTTLIGPHVLLNSTFEAFRGQKAIYAHNSRIGSSIGYDFLGTPLATGFSAGNLNITAAILMGFKKIVLVGHNLGFDVATGSSHAQGVLFDHRTKPNTDEELVKLNATILLPSQDGTSQVRADPGYAIYKLQIEDDVLRHPEVKFYNTAFKGAMIEGCVAAPLEKALSGGDQHGAQVREALQKMMSPVSESVIQERRALIVGRSQELSRKIKSVVSQAEKHLQDVYRVRQRMRKSPINLSLLKEATQLVEALQRFRDEIMSDTDFLHLAGSVLQSQVAPFEREISLLNSKYSGQENIIRGFFEVVIPILAAYIRYLPRIVESLVPLTRAKRLTSTPGVSEASSNAAAS